MRLVDRCRPFARSRDRRVPNGWHRRGQHRCLHWFLWLVFLLAATTSPSINTSTAAISQAMDATGARPTSSSSVTYSYPIRRPSRSPGDGAFVRHGYAAENT